MNNEEDIYKIEGGDMFEGTAQQLDDCFGMYVYQVEDWCIANGWTLEINDVLVSSTISMTFGTED
ncbi:MAG: hypothetical protein KAS32_23340 [Candidatus Peribacteraceae bacterium]|nr:hypothetical protein [Candidatus Peribacteraceae bacterium]